MKLKHLPLIVGIGLPLLCVALLSAAIYIPRQSLKPAHDFVYSQRSGYSSGAMYSYSVVNGKITRSVRNGYNTDASLSPDAETGGLYLYDIETDTVRPLLWAEAKTLSFEPNNLSSDGYRVDYGSRNSGILELFGDSDRNNLYVTKGNVRRALSGMTDNQYRYSYGFTFIGWVK